MPGIIGLVAGIEHTSSLRERHATVSWHPEMLEVFKMLNQCPTYTSLAISQQSIYGVNQVIAIHEKMRFYFFKSAASGGFRDDPKDRLPTSVLAVRILSGYSGQITRAIDQSHAQFQLQKTDTQLP
jgi:hypothetical protein